MNHITIIESPFASDPERNLSYLWAACRHAWEMGEIPFASHGWFPFFLDETTERAEGIAAGYVIGRALRAGLHDGHFSVAFYVDRGWSSGMEAAFRYYTAWGYRTEERRVPGWEET